VGKTSLLYQLRDRLLRNTVVVLLDCQAYGTTAGEYFDAILKRFREELNRRIAKPLPPASGSFRDQFMALRAAWQQSAGAGEALVLIFDEVDKLFPDRRQAGSAGTLTEAIHLFRVLRALAQEQRALSLLLCGYRADLNRQNLLGVEIGENPLHMSLQENFLKFLTQGRQKLWFARSGGGRKSNGPTRLSTKRTIGARAILWLRAFSRAKPANAAHANRSTQLGCLRLRQ